MRTFTVVAGSNVGVADESVNVPDAVEVPYGQE